MGAPSTLRSAIGNVALDADRAARICWGILKGSKGKRGQYRGLFSSFPEVSAEDVHQEMLLAICRQWCQYDPSKGAAPQTFFHQRGHSAMLDLHRRCASGKAKVKRAAAQKQETDFWHHDPELADTDRPLTEMLAENLLLAKKLFNKRKFRRGRRFFTMPQLIAIAMLMRQLKIGKRRCHAMLLARPELITALAMKRVPCQITLLYTARALRTFEQGATPQPEPLNGSDIAAGLTRAKISEETRIPKNGSDMRRCLTHPVENSRFGHLPRTTLSA